MKSEQTLRDLGEREIVNRLIADRFMNVKENFDDAAIIKQEELRGDLVVTTDPCPMPVAFTVLGRDMRLFGDMTVLINVSDLASMGAHPLGILISSVMPEDMAVTEYEAFLTGVEKACRQYQCPLIGGNIKDGQEFSATATALGVTAPGRALQRSRAEGGDRICVIGSMGIFWSAIAAHQFQVELTEGESTVLRQALEHPTAKLREGIFLAEHGYATACMDCSDSIFTCLRELSLASKVTMVVERGRLMPEPVVRKVAKAVDGDVENYMFSWGDWQLVCTIPDRFVEAARQGIEAMGQTFSVIGRVVSGEASVIVVDGNGSHPLSMELSSERFCASSLFSHGVQPYLEKLRRVRF